jgi:hypothetical protein
MPCVSAFAPCAGVFISVLPETDVLPASLGAVAEPAGATVGAVVGATVVAVFAGAVIGAATAGAAGDVTAGAVVLVPLWAKAAIGRIARPVATIPLETTVRMRFMEVFLSTGGFVSRLTRI